MAASPISETSFLILKSALDEAASTLAAIDRGCSLTKIVFVSKNGDGDTSTHYSLKSFVFSNTDFEACLHYLKEHALLPASGKIPVTGVGCDLHRQVIQDVLKLEPEFRSEFMVTFRGVHFLLKNVQNPAEAFHSECLSPEETIHEMSGAGEMKSRMREAALAFYTANNGPDSSALFPCIFTVIGSGCLNMCILDNGKARYRGVSMIGGKTMLALGRYLAGANSYEELMDLASKGNCLNVDTSIDDVIGDNPNSPYARFPKDSPMICFGKLMDINGDLEAYSREDRAAAVIHMMSITVSNLLISAMNRERINRVIIGGNGVNGEAMRKGIIREMSFLMHQGVADVKFLNTGATGAIGAMISNPGEELKFMDI